MNNDVFTERVRNKSARDLAGIWTQNLLYILVKYSYTSHLAPGTGAEDKLHINQHCLEFSAEFQLILTLSAARWGFHNQQTSRV